MFLKQNNSKDVQTKIDNQLEICFERKKVINSSKEIFIKKLHSFQYFIKI